jgi:hypothetical protein
MTLKKQIFLRIIMLSLVSTFLGQILVQTATADGTPKVTIGEAVEVTPEEQKVIVSLMKVQLAAAAGQASNDDDKSFGVELAIIGLGDGYRIGAKKIVEGKSVFFTQAVASSKGELDRVIERLARNLIREKGDSEVDTVTEREEKLLSRRKQSSNRFSFGFGPAFVWGVDDADALYNLKLAFHWENINSRLGIQYEGIGSFENEDQNKVDLDSIGIVMDWIASAEEHSPFFGGDFSYTGIDVDFNNPDTTDVSLSVFSLAGRAGYLFFRSRGAQASAMCFARPALRKVKSKAFGVAGCGVSLDF